MKEPLYKKILHDLQAEIFSGRLAVDFQLPTEKELSERYHVSRITSKRALTELEQAGLIYRVRGKGSFVKASPTQTSLRPAKKATRILFLLPFIHDSSVGNFTDGLLPVMQERQIEAVMGTMDVFEQKSPAELMNEYDGLIYYAENSDPYLDVLVKLALQAFPVISLDKKNFELDFPTILSDNLAGGKLATEFLIAQGHTRIAYLFGHSLHPQSVRNRYIGYLTALDAAGLDFHTPSADNIATSENLFAYLTEHQVTAFVCENDLLAIETMRILKQAGCNIPQDISLVGFDDIQAAALVDPPLTTIAQDFQQIGAIAGKTLIDWIENNQVPNDIKVPVTLVERHSTTKK